MKVPKLTSATHRKLLESVAWAVGGFVFVASYIMSTRRFVTCSNTNFDLAFYIRIVWGLMHGDRYNPLVGAHDLGLHLSPILYIFVPFAHFFPISYTLLTAQALALGICAPLLYRIAIRKTANQFVAVTFCIAWALYPTVLQIGSREFHPGTLALPPLLLAFNFLDRRQILPAVPFLLIATLTREDVALVAALAGALLFLQKGKGRICGILIFAVALIYFFTYTLAIQPAFLPPQGSIDLHFKGFGHTTAEVLGSMLKRPGEVLDKIVRVGNFAYLLELLAPLAFLSLLSPQWLLPAAATLFINFFSTWHDAAKVESHYATFILPSLFFSAISGTERLTAMLRHRCQSKSKTKRAVLAIVTAVVLIASVVMHRERGALPGSKLFDPSYYTWGRNNGILCMYAAELKSLGGNLSVLAPPGALAHLAERKSIYSIHFSHPKPDVAILDISHRKWLHDGIEKWFEPWEVEIERLSSDSSYGLWRSNPPYEILWKGKPGGQERVAAVTPASIPPTARTQNISWSDAVKLEALEARLLIEKEKWSGQYEQRIVVKIVFYWRALKKLPEDLFVKCILTGRGKSQTYFFRPTMGIKKTGKWGKDELIRDEQTFVSPGGWPLKEITASLVFVDRDANPYPKGATLQKLVWPEWEAERDR